MTANPMRNEPIVVAGVDSPVSITSSFWTGKQTVMVGDQLAAPTGKRTYALPRTDGETVEGKVSRTTLINPFPTLEVAGVKHPTGPEIPVALRVLMIAPVVLVPLGGLIGAVFGAGAIAMNYTIIRSLRPTAIKALLMGLTLALAVAAEIALIVLIRR